MSATLHFTHRLRALFACGCLLLVMFSMAGCARPTSTLNHQESEVWAGRISLHVKSEPEQFFSAGFELQGRLDRGELRLISPLGNLLGVLRWSPGEAQFDTGQAGAAQRFDSIDTLMTQATGAAVPLSALFAWLQGEPANVSGWTADLSRYGEGRIVATRMQPQPLVELRIAVDR